MRNIINLNSNEEENGVTNLIKVCIFWNVNIFLQTSTRYNFPYFEKIYF